MANEIIKSTGKNKKNHSNEEKLKAAYALNMCTVSVSQIVDYNDSYILEQEYDAILNNLNLKEIPKDDALLRILTELLNTITFFRIQEIKKQQIEKKYNQRIKSAIWSAVPSLSVVMSGNPVAIAMSLATQIGTGYMNYRKEKNSAKNDKEDAEIELEITAIEQLNSLRRELFTTAWRLADEYDFEDEWRITEKQIKQYNEILRDSDDLRKYARLEAIADRFIAYPPFWYFFGHTANYIVETAKNRISQNDKASDEEILAYSKDVAIVKQYSAFAKNHYEHYFELSKNNILREDQMTASFALEYVDLLWNEEEKDFEKMKSLVRLAEKMAPTSFDILQLCTISYLKLGETDEAARVLKILVNEEYNTSTNAKLLSRIYVSKYLFGDKREADWALAEYHILSATSDCEFLFPMPMKKPSSSKNEDKVLQDKYLEDQKIHLQKHYRVIINEFIKSGMEKYSRLWPIPDTANVRGDDYFDCSIEARKRRLADIESALDHDESRTSYVNALRDASIRVHYLDLLNEMLRSLDELEVFRTYEDKDYLIGKIRKKIVNTRTDLKLFQEKFEKTDFSFEDYLLFQSKFSFRTFTEEFFDELKEALTNQIDAVETVAESLGKTSMQYMEQAELDLIEFCRKNSIPDPDVLRKNNNGMIEIPDYNYYFDYSILGDDLEGENERKEQRSKMRKVVKDSYHSLLIENCNDVVVLLPGTYSFDAYFQNVMLCGAGLKDVVLAIIDDKTRKDYDLLLTYSGVVIIEKNKIQPAVDYKMIRYSKIGNKYELIIDWPAVYSNNAVNIDALYNLITKLSEIKELS